MLCAWHQSNRKACRPALRLLVGWNKPVHYAGCPRYRQLPEGMAWSDSSSSSGAADSGWRYPALFGIQRGLSSVLRFCRHPLFTIGAIFVLFSGRTDSQHQYNVTPVRRGRVGRRVADDRAGSARELIRSYALGLKASYVTESGFG